jgi:hypothetical protein
MTRPRGSCKFPAVAAYLAALSKPELDAEFPATLLARFPGVLQLKGQAHNCLSQERRRRAQGATTFAESKLNILEGEEEEKGESEE